MPGHGDVPSIVRLHEALIKVGKPPVELASYGLRLGHPLGFLGYAVPQGLDGAIHSHEPFHLLERNGCVAFGILRLHDILA